MARRPKRASIESAPESAPAKTVATPTERPVATRKEPNGIRPHIQRLVIDVSAIVLSVEDISKSLERRIRKSAEEIKEISALFTNIKKTKSEGSTFSVPFEEAPGIMKSIQNMGIVSSSISIFGEAYLLALVSKWDKYFSSVLRYSFEARPGLIDSSEKTLSLSEITALGSVDEARRSVIEGQIDTIMRGSHLSQFAYLEGKLGTTFRSDEDLLAKFVEIVQRRHLVAHTGSRISQKYIEECKASKVVHGQQIRVGDKFLISKNYIKSAAACIIEFGAKLSLVVWNKLHPDEAEQANESFLLIAYDLIESEQYETAIKLLKFLLESKVKLTSQEQRLRATINLAQAYRWTNDINGCERLLSETDWSAVSDKYLLGVAVLRGQFEEAGKIMRRIGRDGSISEADYIGWPLFKEFRESDVFKETYRGIFGKDAELEEPEIASAELQAVAQIASVSTRTLAQIEEILPEK